MEGGLRFLKVKGLSSEGLISGCPVRVRTSNLSAKMIRDANFTTGQFLSLSDRVRTCDLRVPNSPLYQTELHLVFENYFTLFPKEYFHHQTVTLCGL